MAKSILCSPRAALRFWGRVRVRGPEECWPYGNGRWYGKFQHCGVRVGAHRLSLEHATADQIRREYGLLPRGPSGRVVRGAMKALAARYGVSKALIVKIGVPR